MGRMRNVVRMCRNVWVGAGSSLKKAKSLFSTAEHQQVSLNFFKSQSVLFRDINIKICKKSWKSLSLENGQSVSRRSWQWRRVTGEQKECYFRKSYKKISFLRMRNKASGRKGRGRLCVQNNHATPCLLQQQPGPLPEVQVYCLSSPAPSAVSRRRGPPQSHPHSFPSASRALEDFPL